MKRNNYIRYFRVYQNDTVVTEISTNDFKPLKLKPLKQDWLAPITDVVISVIADVKYSFPIGTPLFYGYMDEATAMEMAKAGALKYIDGLIAKGEAGTDDLYHYRYNHYEDLNVNLLEANILKVKNIAAANKLNVH